MAYFLSQFNFPFADTIFVRVYEARMELLRAVIIGPPGTPYHDGLFVFDCLFPTNYPKSPPVCICYHYIGFYCLFGLLYVLTSEFLLSDGVLLFRRSSIKSKFVWMWESLSQSPRHLEWKTKWKLGPRAINNATSFSLYTSSYSECRPLLQWAGVWYNVCWSRRAKEVQELQWGSIYFIPKDDDVYTKEAT